MYFRLNAMKYFRLNAMKYFRLNAVKYSRMNAMNFRMIVFTFITCLVGSAAMAQSTIGARGPLGSLNLSLGQSSSQSSVATSQSLTTMDGYPGYFSSGIIRPFVTGFTPVVGDYPVFIDREAEAQQEQWSTLYQAQARATNKRLLGYVRRAERAEKDGNLRMARANYRRAAAIASGPFKYELLAKLKQ